MIAVYLLTIVCLIVGSNNFESCFLNIPVVHAIWVLRHALSSLSSLTLFTSLSAFLLALTSQLHDAPHTTITTQHLIPSS